MEYPWKRFWCPRDGKISLLDGGFLIDPDHGSEWHESDVVGYNQIEKYPCLALLGEPGIGKSTALMNIYKSIMETIDGTDDQSLYFDLCQYGDEKRLIEDIFKNDIILKWQNGSYNLYLVIDSLDECRIHLPHIASIIASQFRVLKQHLNRLVLRFACRTFDWPISFESSLPELWGADSYRAFELVPLRRVDVEMAIENEEIEKSDFFQELNRVDAVPLAIRPITLNLLIKLFNKNQKLPHSRSYLYEKGSLLLCSEINTRRQDLIPFQTHTMLSPSQLLTLASRIAAITVFCKKASIRIDEITEYNDLNEICISEIVEQEEHSEKNIGTLAINHIMEVLGTGLFSSRGIKRMGFCHQIFVDFLAARYINECNIPTKTKLELVCHPTDQDKSVIPQLNEVSAWIADKDDTFLEKLSHINPKILLRSDSIALSESNRVEITEGLLHALNEKQTNDREWEFRKQYNKLDHSDLTNQLRPWIVNKDIFVVARRSAIEIATACHKYELQHDIVKIALDENEENHIRFIAADSIAEIGDMQSKMLLKPFLSDRSSEDPDDQLKGAALNALWPNLLTARELFEVLTLPKRESFYGSYLHFVGNNLLDHLKPDDLPIAIEWVITHLDGDGLGLRMGRFGDEVIILAWKKMQNAKIAEKLGELTANLYRHHNDLLDSPTNKEKHYDLFSDQIKRRKLAEIMINKYLDVRSVIYLNFLWPNLIRDDDYEWCVNNLLMSICYEEEASWAEIVWALFRWRDINTYDLELFLKAVKRSPKLRILSSSLLEPVQLNSERADEMKKQYEEMHLDRKKGKPKKLKWLPKDRIAYYLDKVENGEYDKWWVLLRQLTLKDTETANYNDIFEVDITLLPGWINSSLSVKNKLIDEAEKYLNALEYYDSFSLINSSADEQHAGAYKAFALIFKKNKNRLQSLSEEVWKHWLPIIFGPFGIEASKKEIQDELISMAYNKIPIEVLELIKTFFNNKINKSNRVDILERIDNIWDNNIADIVYATLQKNRANTSNWSEILDFLVKHNDFRSIEFAKQELSLSSSKNEIDREISIQSALILIRRTPDASWSVLWEKIQSEPDFGKRVLSELSSKLYRGFLDFFAKLEKNEIGNLYLWLVYHFPYNEDPNYDGVFTPTKDDSARELRNDALLYLENDGTPSSVKILKNIVDLLPKYEWLKIRYIEAKSKMLQKTWQPLLPQDFFAIISNPKAAMIRGASELQEIVLKTLQDLEYVLQGETPAAQDLWNQISKDKYRPKDENHLSDWVKRNLEQKFTHKAIVVAREVEIRRGIIGNPGEKTDIHITALVPCYTENSYEQVRVIIETKGSWNRELKSAIYSQLAYRYLKDNDCNHGIYLIGWFNCSQWDDDDYRKSDSYKWSKDDLSCYLNEQNDKLAKEGYIIKSYILSTALR